MTRRALYAPPRGMLQLAAVSFALLALPSLAFTQPAPCASCLVPVVTPGAAATFPEPLHGVDVLVRVAFTPAVASARQSGIVERGLFRGRVWIAKDSFAMVKVAATQTGLRGAIVSSEQIDEFRETPAGLWLLAGRRFASSTKERDTGRQSRASSRSRPTR